MKPWTRINDLHPDIIGYAAGSTYEPICQLLPPGKLAAPDDPITLRKEANAALIMALPELAARLEALTEMAESVAGNVDNGEALAEAINSLERHAGYARAALTKAGL